MRIESMTIGLLEFLQDIKGQKSNGITLNATVGQASANIWPYLWTHKWLSAINY